GYVRRFYMKKSVRKICILGTIQLCVYKGGGLLIYKKNIIPFKYNNALHFQSLEYVWIEFVYHPPHSSKDLITAYEMQSGSLLCCRMLVTNPTRITKSSRTLIEHLYSSRPDNITEVLVPAYGLSDNDP
ncbi:hypothetical protein MAR_027916, partial [Mya arenaria]